MSINPKQILNDNPEVVNKIIDVVDEEIFDYSKTTSTSTIGKVFRKLSSIIHIFLPFLKSKGGNGNEINI